jgi:DNA-binding transcriptional LysR family regulator
MSSAPVVADTAVVKDMKGTAGSRWWDFIGYRRRYVSDRTWFGAALIAAGVGGLSQVPGWWKAADLAGALIGVVLVQSGVRRALRRRDFTTNETQPRPPW